MVGESEGDPRPSTDQEDAPLLRDPHSEAEQGNANGVSSQPQNHHHHHPFHRIKTWINDSFHKTKTNVHQGYNKVLVKYHQHREDELSNQHAHKDLTTVEGWLIGGVIILLVLTVLGFGLFDNEVGKRKDLEKKIGDGGGTSTVVITTTTTATASPGGPTDIPNDGICTTRDCVRAAGKILSGLDLTVDPCDDFYSYANNNWLKTHPIPAERSSYGNMEMIDENNKHIILDLLQSSSPPSSSSSSPFLSVISKLRNIAGLGSTDQGKQDKDDGDKDREEQRAEEENFELLQTFYGTCMDQDALDRKGDDPLFELLRPVIDIWRGKDSSYSQSSSATPSAPPHIDLSRHSGPQIPFSPNHNSRAGDGLHTEFKKDRRWDFWPPFDWPPWDGDDDKRKEPKRGDSETRKERLTEVLVWLHARAVPAFFLPYMDGDYVVDPNLNRLWFTQAGLGLPSQDYYSDDPNDKLMSIYHDTIAKSLEQIYENGLEEKWGEGEGWQDLATSVLDFEKKIAKASAPVLALYDPVGTYNPKNSSTLAKLFPLVHFNDYFSGFFPRPEYPDPIIIAVPEFFNSLTNLIANESESTLEAYFVWLTTQLYAPLVGPSSKIRQPVDHLMNTIKGVPDAELGDEKARSETCLNSLLGNLGFMVGSEYIKLAFSPEAKRYGEEVIYSIIQAFEDRLKDVEWMADKDTEAALRKAKNIAVKIGYPTSPDVTDPVKVERYYSINKPIQQGHHLENVLNSRMADERRIWAQIGHKKDMGTWDMIPSEVNAYFNPPWNEIVFPAGVLQPPMYDAAWPEYMIFGAFGSVAGHELSHAFDSVGRQFDETGKLRDWWSNSTIDAFDKRKECVIEQYSHYYMVDEDGNKHYVRSNQTIPEDLADAGGHAQSYRAWKDRFDSDPDGKKYFNPVLPGLDNYTREQMWFIAYGQMWARKLTQGEALRRIRIDVHSPTFARVNGVLANDVEFAKVFNCPIGSPMNKADKCEIW